MNTLIEIVITSFAAKSVKMGGITMKYRIALYYSDEGYSVSVPGLPGCWSQGSTEEEAIENVKIAISEYSTVVEEQLKGQEIRVIEVI